MSGPETALLVPGSDEWERAWDKLADRYGDPVARCPDSGEEWQYMGSTTYEPLRRISGANPRPGWCHEFRHRHHPDYGRRLYAAVRASDGWTPDDEPVRVAR